MIDQKQIELVDVLLSLTEKYETSGFTILGQGFPETEAQYNTMVSFDDISHKPTWQQVVQEYDVLLGEQEKTKYVFQRSKEYPSIEEQLDLIFHGGLEEWQQQIQAIKDKYPKPE